MAQAAASSASPSAKSADKSSSASTIIPEQFRAVNFLCKDALVTSNTHRFDQWHVNGEPCFGTVPAGCISEVGQDTPIFLFRGNIEWGWEHITHGHRQNNLFKFAQTIEEVIWERCGIQGAVHACDRKDKLSVSISLAPRAFMVLTYVPDFNAFSITTMYSKRKDNPYEYLNPYPGRENSPEKPIFSLIPYKRPHLPTPTSAVQVFFKKKRSTLITPNSEDLDKSL